MDEQEHVDQDQTGVFIHALKYDVDQYNQQACFFVDQVPEQELSGSTTTQQFLWQSQKWKITMYDVSKLPPAPATKRHQHRRLVRRLRQAGEGHEYVVSETLTSIPRDGAIRTLKESVWRPKDVSVDESFILVTFDEDHDITQQTINESDISKSFTTSYKASVSTHEDFESTFNESYEEIFEKLLAQPLGGLVQLTYITEKLLHLSDNSKEGLELYEIKPVNIKLQFEDPTLWVNPYEGQYGMEMSQFQISECFGDSIESSLVQVEKRGGGYLSDFSLSLSNIRRMKRFRKSDNNKDRMRYTNLPTDTVVIDAIKPTIMESDEEDFEDLSVDFENLQDQKVKQVARNQKNRYPPKQFVEHEPLPPTLLSMKGNEKYSELVRQRLNISQLPPKESNDPVLSKPDTNSNLNAEHYPERSGGDVTEQPEKPNVRVEPDNINAEIRSNPDSDICDSGYEENIEHSARSQTVDKTKDGSSNDSVEDEPPFEAPTQQQTFIYENPDEEDVIIAEPSSPNRMKTLENTNKGLTVSNIDAVICIPYESPDNTTSSVKKTTKTSSFQEVIEETQVLPTQHTLKADVDFSSFEKLQGPGVNMFSDIENNTIDNEVEDTEEREPDTNNANDEETTNQNDGTIKDFNEFYIKPDTTTTMQQDVENVLPKHHKTNTEKKHQQIKPFEQSENVPVSVTVIPKQNFEQIHSKTYNTSNESVSRKRDTNLLVDDENECQEFVTSDKNIDSDIHNLIESVNDNDDKENINDLKEFQIRHDDDKNIISKPTETEGEVGTCHNNEHSVGGHDVYDDKTIDNFKKHFVKPENTSMQQDEEHILPKSLCTGTRQQKHPSPVGTHIEETVPILEAAPILEESETECFEVSDKNFTHKRQFNKPIVIIDEGEIQETLKDDADITVNDFQILSTIDADEKAITDLKEHFVKSDFTSMQQDEEQILPKSQFTGTRQQKHPSSIGTHIEEAVPILAAAPILEESDTECFEVSDKNFTHKRQFNKPIVIIDEGEIQETLKDDADISVDGFQILSTIDADEKAIADLKEHYVKSDFTSMHQDEEHVLPKSHFTGTRQQKHPSPVGAHIEEAVPILAVVPILEETDTESVVVSDKNFNQKHKPNKPVVIIDEGEIQETLKDDADISVNDFQILATIDADEKAIADLKEHYVKSDFTSMHQDEEQVLPKSHLIGTRQQKHLSKVSTHIEEAVPILAAAPILEESDTESFEVSDKSFTQKRESNMTGFLIDEDEVQETLKDDADISVNGFQILSAIDADEKAIADLKEHYVKSDFTSMHQDEEQVLPKSHFTGTRQQKHPSPVSTHIEETIPILAAAPILEETDTESVVVSDKNFNQKRRSNKPVVIMDEDEIQETVKDDADIPYTLPLDPDEKAMTEFKDLYVKPAEKTFIEPNEEDVLSKSSTPIAKTCLKLPRSEEGVSVSLILIPKQDIQTVDSTDTVIKQKRNETAISQVNEEECHQSLKSNKLIDADIDISPQLPTTKPHTPKKHRSRKSSNASSSSSFKKDLDYKYEDYIVDHELKPSSSGGGDGIITETSSSPHYRRKPLNSTNDTSGYVVTLTSTPRSPTSLTSKSKYKENDFVDLDDNASDETKVRVTSTPTKSQYNENESLDLDKGTVLSSTPQITLISAKFNSPSISKSDYREKNTVDLDEKTVTKSEKKKSLPTKAKSFVLKKLGSSKHDNDNDEQSKQTKKNRKSSGGFKHLRSSIRTKISGKKLDHSTVSFDERDMQDGSTVAASRSKKGLIGVQRLKYEKDDDIDEEEKRSSAGYNVTLYKQPNDFEYRPRLTRSRSFESILDDKDKDCSKREKEREQRRRRLAGYSFVSRENIPGEEQIVKGRDYSDVEKIYRETEKELAHIRKERRKKLGDGELSKSSFDILDVKRQQQTEDKKLQELEDVRKQRRKNLSKNSQSMDVPLDTVSKMREIGRIEIPEVFLSKGRRPDDKSTVQPKSRKSTDVKHKMFMPMSREMTL